VDCWVLAIAEMGDLDIRQGSKEKHKSQNLKTLVFGDSKPERKSETLEKKTSRETHRIS